MLFRSAESRMPFSASKEDKRSNASLSCDVRACLTAVFRSPAVTFSGCCSILASTIENPLVSVLHEKMQLSNRKINDEMALCFIYSADFRIESSTPFMNLKESSVPNSFAISIASSITIWYGISF